MKKLLKDWESILNSISDLISIHDKTYRLIWVNHAFVKMFNKNRNEIIGEKCFEIIHDKSLIRARCQVFNFSVLLIILLIVV